MEKVEVDIWESVKRTYKISKSLGNGSFGQVIQGKNRETGQKVAIKLIKDI
jgi:serine/threonine protein kinase